MTTTVPSARRWGVSSPRVLSLTQDYLRDAAVRTHARLGDVVGVAVTSAVADGEPLTAGASTPLAAEVDRVQYAIGHGPCLATLREGHGLYVPDLARDPRWGRYGPEAAALGVRCSLSVPVLDGSSVVVGVVKVYAAEVDGLDERQREVGRAFGLEVAGGVGLASTLVATSLELDDRIEAMNTRRPIDLATGLLMGRLGCGPEAAFDVLRRESQHRNVKVHDLAADLLLQPPPRGEDQDDHRSGPAGGSAPFRKRGEEPVRGR